MRPTTTTRTVMLALGLLLTAGTGTAMARPSDGARDTQDFAYVDLAAWLDACSRVDIRASFVAGDLLKGQLSDGAPTSWSDLTITLAVRDECAGTVTDLTGYAIAPPDIERLERAAVSSITVTVVDPSGQLEAELTATFDWTVAGPATSIQNIDLVSRYFRAERVAPAEVHGGLQIVDSDGDVFPPGFALPEATISGGVIGFANEISLCCP